MTARVFLPVIAMACLPMTLGMDDDASGSSSRPPMFDGNRLTFTTWFMTFSAWVAWKLTVYSDSKSAVDMSLDPVAFKNTKHILRAAEFLRDLVAKEVLRLEHISGTYMLADLLTKAVSRPIFLQLMELLGAYARTGVSALHS